MVKQMGLFIMEFLRGISMKNRKNKKVVCRNCNRKQEESNVCKHCGYWDMWGINF